MRKLLTILFLMITLVTQAQRQRILLTKCQTPCEKMSDYDWRDYMEVSEYKEVIDKNFSYKEFEEVFAINIGLPSFRTKKDKLSWMSLITEPKGKKTSALTRSDLNRLELINQHLTNYISED